MGEIFYFPFSFKTKKNLIPPLFSVKEHEAESRVSSSDMLTPRQLQLRLRTIQIAPISHVCYLHYVNQTTNETARFRPKWHVR